MAKREVEQWITINGVHVPVFKGESKADAAKNFKARSGKRNANQPITQKGKANAKKEYTNARNAAHNASEDKKEKADARFDKAKQKYTEAKEKKVIKSAARTGDKAQRSGVYKEQLKDVQDDIKQFESTPERLRSVDYDKKLADLKQKEANLKGYMNRDKKSGDRLSSIDTKEKALQTIQNLRPQEGASAKQWEDYTNIQGELARKFNLSKEEQRTGKEAVAKTSTDNVTSARNYSDLTDKLNKNGLKMDSADVHTIQNSNSLNGKKVTMYDKDGNEYKGTYNKYSDGGREIVNIKKTADSPRKIANDNEDLKEKQIARNKEEAKEASYNSVAKDAEEYRKNPLVASKWGEGYYQEVKDYIKQNDVYDKVKSDPEMKKTANELIAQGMQFDQAAVLAYKYGSKEYKQKVSEIKKHMEEHDTGLPAAKEHYDYMHPDDKASGSPKILSYNEMVAKYGKEALDKAGISKPDANANVGEVKRQMEKYKSSSNYSDQKLAGYRQDVAKAQEKNKKLAMEILAKAGVGDKATSSVKKGVLSQIEKQADNLRSSNMDYKLVSKSELVGRLLKQYRKNNNLTQEQWKKLYDEYFKKYH